jgi:hypothetical protein
MHPNRARSLGLPRPETLSNWHLTRSSAGPPSVHQTTFDSARLELYDCSDVNLLLRQPLGKDQGWAAQRLEQWTVLDDNCAAGLPGHPEPASLLTRSPIPADARREHHRAHQQQRKRRGRKEPQGRIVASLGREYPPQVARRLPTCYAKLPPPLRT